MATLAVSSIVESEWITEDANGKAYNRRYLVANVSGTDAQFDALAAVPAYGEPHPSQPNLFVSRRATKPFAKNSRTQVYVDVEWRPADFSNLGATIVSYDGMAREIQTNYDRDGNPIKVRYTPTGGSAMQEETGWVRGYEAVGVLEADFFTATDPTIYTLAKNKLNSTTFRGRPKWTWLCTRARVIKDFSRSGWRVSIALEEHERDNGYVAVAAYRIYGGVVPSDIDPIDQSSIGQSNGYTTALINGQMDMTTLNIPNSGF